VTRYIIRRVLWLIPVLLFVSVITFTLMHLTPGGPWDKEKAVSPQVIANLNAKYNLDKPAWQQYLIYMGGVLRGDLGPSYTYQDRSVTQIILGGLPATASLGFFAAMIALMIGVPLGVLASTRNERPSDLGIRLFAMLGQSTPSFVIGLVIIYVLSVVFGVVPSMGTFTPLFVDPVTNLGQLIFPAVTLGFAFAASVTRISRSAMLDVLSDDYIRTARSKGASPRSVVWGHALPNALIPVVTISGVEFGYLLGGAVIVEQIYALPGIGRLVLDAINQRDYALVQGTVLFIAFNFLVVNLLVDLAYVALDPRIRLGGR